MDAVRHLGDELSQQQPAPLLCPAHSASAPGRAAAGRPDPGGQQSAGHVAAAAPAEVQSHALGTAAGRAGGPAPLGPDRERYALAASAPQPRAAAPVDGTGPAADGHAQPGVPGGGRRTGGHPGRRDQRQ